MRLASAGCALSTVAAVAATASCNIVLSIEPYEAGPSEEAGLDAGHDARSEAAVDSGEAGLCSTPMQVRCAAGGLETCTDGMWSSPNPCLPGQTCIAGACAPTPVSCLPGGTGQTNCGPSGDQSCCSSAEEIVGGSFYRSYDGISSGYSTKASPASVSSFVLDGYEVTVGRFRRFVTAVVGGYDPPQGSGVHKHLNGGKGLAATSGTFELGWETSWNENLATTTDGWNGNLAGGTWTPMSGASENLPISEVSWYEAYAFCIWDGGFLPSEAEWNFAAAGGSDQRAYPWSLRYPPGSTTIACTNANTSDCIRMANAVGSESPPGDGKWGQSDLSGNVWEWTLDYQAPYSATCVDCADLTPSASRVDRGGSFRASQSLGLVSTRNSSNPAMRAEDVGVRCARSPR